MPPLLPLPRLAVAAALATLPTAHGGWAVVTLRHLPDEIIVGRPTTLEFTVRQHGRTLLTGLAGRVVAEASEGRVEVHAQPGDGPGRYRATLTLPRGGAWTITVFSGFGPSTVTLMPIPAVNPGRTAPALPAGQVGRRLFVAKGCLICHRHDAVEGSGRVDVGPNLTKLRLDPGFLSRFLADPTLLPPDPRGWQMPNLELVPAEIAALVAFIDGESVAGRE